MTKTVRNSVAGLACLLASSHGGVAVSMAVGAPRHAGCRRHCQRLCRFHDEEEQVAGRSRLCRVGGNERTLRHGQCRNRRLRCKVGQCVIDGWGHHRSIARTYVDNTLGDTTTTSTGVSIDAAKGTVQVTLTDAWHPFFAHFLGANITPIVVDARAELVGESKVCVIALKPSGAGAISMTKNAISRAMAAVSIPTPPTRRESLWVRIVDHR